MKGKRGIEFNLATIAIAILILIGLILVVVYTLGGFTKLTGGEGIGKAQTEARAGLLGVDWDALTQKEQKELIKKTPKEAAEIQLDTADAYLKGDSKEKNYDGAIALAKAVYDNPPTDTLKTRAKKIIDAAEYEKKLLAVKNELLKQQEAKVSESEAKISGFEWYRERFNKLFTQEGVVIRVNVGEEKLVGSNSEYNFIVGELEKLLTDLDEFVKGKETIKKEIGYLKLKSNIYLELIKIYSIGKDPDSSLGNTNIAFNKDVDLKVQTTYEGESVLEGVLYYVSTFLYNLGQRNQAVLGDLMDFYKKYGELSKFSPSIMKKIHEVYLITADITDYCHSGIAHKSEKDCRAKNVDSIGKGITMGIMGEGKKYPKAVCYYEYSAGTWGVDTNECETCFKINSCDDMEETGKMWQDQCNEDPCGLGCKVKGNDCIEG